MGQSRISRARGGLVTMLAVAAIACGGCDDGSSTGIIVGTGFNRAPGFTSTVYGIVPAGDGSGNVYVGGDFTGYNGIQVNRMVRLKSDGTIDPAFVAGVGFNGTVRSIMPVGDGTGDLYVGGNFTGYNGNSVTRLVRLHPDGTVETGFVTGTGFNNTVYSIAPAGDGSGNVYVGGAFTSYNGQMANGLLRLHADGTVDLTFMTGAGFIGARPESNVRSIVPTGDGTGKLYVGGDFTSYNGTVANGLVRLKSDGTIDPAFGTGTGFNNIVYSIALAGDGTGNVYVGGAFTGYNGLVVNDLVRLHTNGTVDAAFGTGTGFNDTVFSFAPAVDGTGDLFAGGAFTKYQSLTVGRIVRLQSNGIPVN